MISLCSFHGSTAGADLSYVLDFGVTKEGRVVIISTFLHARSSCEKTYAFLRQSKNDPPLSLREAIESFIEINPESQASSLAILLTKDNFLYVALYGALSLYLVRSGELGKILSHSKNLIVSSSGPLKIGDLVLLGNDQFINTARETLPVGVGVKVSIEPETKKVLSVLTSLIGRIRLPERRIYLSRKKVSATPKKKILILFVIVVFIILSLSIIRGFLVAQSAKKKVAYEPRLTEAKHDYDEAKSIFSLDQTRAKDLIITAKRIAGELKSQGVNDPDLTRLISDISNDIGRISGVYEVKPNLYLDLTLIAQDFNVDDISVSSGRGVFLYRNGRKLVSVVLSSKETQTFSIPQQLPGDILVSAYSDRNFVASHEGIWSVSSDSSKLLDFSVDGPFLIYSYTGNIYLMDKKNSKILRYQGLPGGGYGAPENWFGAGISPDLTHAKSWIIDGSVWVLNEDGSFLKFLGGAPDYFVLNSPFSEALHPTDFYTDENSENLYILDSLNSKVLVFDKKGNFKNAYSSDQIKDAKRILVTESDRKIILVLASKLYYIDIK